jgi:NAD(P)-dependent dehydrogenase (short-subunit alcohol dehydrogenase family)
MLTQSLARELAPRVRVNAIAPGPVMFPENGLSEEMKQDIIARTLLQAAGQPRGHRARGAVLRPRRAVHHRADPRRGRRAQRQA